MCCVCACNHTGEERGYVATPTRGARRTATTAPSAHVWPDGDTTHQCMWRGHTHHSTACMYSHDRTHLPPSSVSSLHSARHRSCHARPRATGLCPTQGAPRCEWGWSPVPASVCPASALTVGWMDGALMVALQAGRQLTRRVLVCVFLGCFCGMRAEIHSKGSTRADIPVCCRRVFPSFLVMSLFVSRWQSTWRACFHVFLLFLLFFLFFFLVLHSLCSTSDGTMCVCLWCERSNACQRHSSRGAQVVAVWRNTKHTTALAAGQAG